LDDQPITPVLDYSAEYYSPPRVQWWVLLVISAAFSIAVSLIIAKPYQSLCRGLIWDAWAIYICLWIRRLNPRAQSLYWVLGALASEVIGAVFESPLQDFEWTDFVSLLSYLCAAVCWIVCIYAVRSELVRHYNQHEQFCLVLGPVMTFFFSFLYFQYHLYDIAVQKQKEARQ